MNTIPVVAGAAHYDVLVGALDQARDCIPPSTILVSEANVFALHGERVRALLGGDPPILLPEGEAAKQWDVLHRLLCQLAERGASRSTAIVALGGGSVGDVAGLIERADEHVVASWSGNDVDALHCAKRSRSATTIASTTSPCAPSPLRIWMSASA